MCHLPRYSCSYGVSTSSIRCPLPVPLSGKPPARLIPIPYPLPPLFHSVVNPSLFLFPYIPCPLPVPLSCKPLALPLPLRPLPVPPCSNPLACCDLDNYSKKAWSFLSCKPFAVAPKIKNPCSSLPPSLPVAKNPLRCCGPDFFFFFLSSCVPKS